MSGARSRRRAKLPTVPPNRVIREDQAAPVPTVTYWGVSIFNSRTMWFNAANFLVAALTLTEVVTLIPARWLPLQAAVVALVNMWLRTVTVRPVQFIAPGATIPVEVAKVGPPDPPVMGD